MIKLLSAERHREGPGQLVVFSVLLATNAFLAFLVLALGLQGDLATGQEMPPALDDVPAWVLGLANGGLILVLYGLLGLAGLWFARKVGLPGVYRRDAGWRHWVIIPMAVGMAVGVAMVGFDRLFASAREWVGLSHPPFPMSLLASGIAGIGEEIVFRVFVMGLWAFLLNLVLRRWQVANVALWAANGIAALAFAAGHLPAVMALTGASDLAGLPPVVLLEVFLLNGLVGMIAGERYVVDGPVAAAGVHFWADIVWHVLWPLVSA